jgi:hypothetical protein
MLNKSKQTQEEWKQHIATNVSIDGHTGCWSWKKAKGSGGYGVTWFNGKTVYAHRMSYYAYVGEYDPSFLVMHTCDNPCCVNPKHLCLGTDQDNSSDMVTKDRQAKGSKNGLAKLTESLIPYIKESTASSRQLGKELGVCKTVILDIKRGLIWKHA